MKLLKQNEYKTAAEILKNGGIVAFPTETVFGIGVISGNDEAYEKLIKIKRRPPEKPFTLMCGDVNDIKKYAIVDKIADKLIKKFMPGQFTIILPALETTEKNAVSAGMVGIRVSSDNLVTNLIKAVGKPLFVPSANKAGEKPAYTSSEVLNIFNDELDAIIEGESVSNVPSTIVQVKDGNVLRRRLGAITEEDIAKAIKE